MPVLNQCYQLVSGQYKPSSGTFTACSQRLGLQSRTLWHILQKWFILTMISLKIISIFSWWLGQPHTLIHCPHWMVLVWFWSSITGRGNVHRVTDCMWPLCLCPRNILNNLVFSFKPMLIRLKIVGDVRYTCKIAKNYWMLTTLSC